MKKVLISVAIYLFLIFAVPLFALEWPVENPMLKSTFAENKGGSFNTGIDIVAEKPPVKAVADGDVIYYREENSNLFSLPSGLGNFVILEHDRQLRTLYANLGTESFLKNKDRAKAGDVLGVISNNGIASERYFHFEVIDRELSEIVNPVVLFPLIPDSTKPVIEEVSIKREGENNYTRLYSRNTIKAGKYDLSAVIYDISENRRQTGKDRVAPYKVSIYLNGEEVYALKYNSLKNNNNTLAINGKSVGAKEYYPFPDNPWQIYLGNFDFKIGTIRIEIVTGDYAGNETTRNFLLISGR